MKQKTIITLTLSLAMLTGCGKVESEQVSIAKTESSVTAVSEQAETREAATDALETEPAVVTEKNPEYGKRDVQDAREWVVKHLWNDGIHTIESYAMKGTDVVGRSVDIDFCIDNLLTAYGEKEKHNAVVHALDDSIPEQKQLISAWDKLIEQADMLIEKIETEKPEPNDENYVLETDLFFQYMDVFIDACSKVANNKDSDEKGLPVFK